MNASKKPIQASLAIAATFTTEPLSPALQYLLHETDLALTVRLAPYNQVFQELLSPTSVLATNTGGLDVVLVRLEDFVRDIENTDEARRIVGRTVTELTDALSRHARHATVPTLLVAMPPSPHLAKTLQTEIRASNSAFLTDIASLPGITVMASRELEPLLPEKGYDRLTDELGHVPFTEEQYASIALAIVRKVHALLVPPHKVLALDCDETLWRGVIGEDGVEGLIVSRACAGLQQFAVEAQARGVLICLISKNAESDVFEVFEKRSDMILKPEHIVAHRINWQPKTRNIASLARELNIGLDAFVFIDDNPAECALMRAELPEVVSLQLPPEDEVESFLSNLWVFDKLTVSAEDTRRTAMYRENAARQALQESTGDVAQFIASLGLVIDIAPPQDHEWARVAQLTQRTNQFNFTTVRRTEPEMRALVVSGFTVLRVNVRDRFGDYGLVGLVIAAVKSGTLEIETLLLSCRVLGKGVEHSIVRRLGEIATQWGLQHVDLRFVPTAKNEPARTFVESVAAEFGVEDRGRVLYHIPCGSACAIAYSPRSNPVASLEAHRPQDNHDSPTSTSKSHIDPSERYRKLAQLLVSGSAIVSATGAAARSRSLPGHPVKAATETERQLLAVWQEVLRTEGLGVEDDYFELGGTSLLAVGLMAEISRRFDVRLPLTSIIESPTVRALSTKIGRPLDARSQTLIQLKGGGPRALFLVHDGDGETLLYLNLAQHMPEDMAVFGIQPYRRERVPLAHTTIEDMATFYVKQVRERQPSGPYLLGGMCYGGVIAYEMASQLHRAGETVDLVALLDSARPRAVKRAGRIAKGRLRRFKQALVHTQRRETSRWKQVWLGSGAVTRKSVNLICWEIVHRARTCSAYARFHLLREILRRGLTWPKFVPQLTAREIISPAQKLYNPPPLAIPSVVLVRAQNGERDDTPFREIYAEETFGWNDCAPGLTLINVGGGHSSMLQGDFGVALANALVAFLQQNAGGVPAPSYEVAV